MFSTQSRDRTGMEVNPLVFETSASTNSAIWAFAFLLMRCKGTHIFYLCKRSAIFFQIIYSFRGII